MSSPSKRSDMRNTLLAAIQRKVPVTPPLSEPEPNPSAPVSQSEPDPKQPRPPKAADKPRRRKGKQVQFWFHEEDGRLVRELAAWLAGQGLRPTDSLVIRAALRNAQTGAGLLEAYRRAAELDGRLKRHRDK